MVFASDAQLLVGIDDTAPKSLSGSGSYSPMSAAGPLRLYFNEAVKLGDFSVVKHYRDYTTHADEDVSARFELVKIGEQTISLRLLSGEHFDSNASYDISVNRITDMADNLAVGDYLSAAGSYKATIAAPDTLPPRELTVVRAKDGASVNEAMLLTKGRSYTFKVAAIDNYTGSAGINYSYRLATAFGTASTSWRTIAPNDKGNMYFRTMPCRGMPILKFKCEHKIA